LQDVEAKGVTQTVHVLVTTYGEAAEMVRECVVRLLAAPEPIDMEKYIYVCDDGHAKPEGPKKKAVVEELRTIGVLLSIWLGAQKVGLNLGLCCMTSFLCAGSSHT
jgi:cellulose synthase/poly-beta-1,6-N-acetylglucosamine synthase-like glycosyltransferase